MSVGGKNASGVAVASVFPRREPSRARNPSRLFHRDSFVRIFLLGLESSTSPISTSLCLIIFLSHN